MGIKNAIKKVAGKAGDQVAKLSSLSPEQLENVQLLREKYLLETPNPNDATARELTERLMAASSVEIFNAYLPQIKDLYLPLNNEAEFGKEFDSFSDAISFGLAPSMLIYSILSSKVPSSPFIVPVSFLYALCGVMRLVKFNIINIASSEKGDFSGMPIPNAAAMVVSYVMICNVVYEKFLINLFDIKVFIGISVISASLMVSTIPFKTPDKTFSFIPKKVALGLILALLITMYWTLDYSVFIISYLYVLLNIISYFNKRFLSNENDTSVDEFIEIEIDDEEKRE